MVPSDGDLLVRRGGRWVFEQGLFYTKAEVDALIAAAVHAAITAHESSEHILS